MSDLVRAGNAALATSAIELTPEMAVSRAVNQVQIVQAVMHKVMVRDTHFGHIPGTPDDKMTLYQAGADTLCLAFGFTSEPEPVTITELAGGHREYSAKVKLYHRSTGGLVAVAEGSCSTMESKYRWRGARGKPCPKCNEPAMKAARADWGGGYYCDQRVGGCGTKVKAGTPEARALDGIKVEGRQENPDIADVYNTCLKMAQKRAYVSAVIRATGASDLFTQDLDDGTPIDGYDGAGRPEVKTPASKTSKAGKAVMSGQDQRGDDRPPAPATGDRPSPVLKESERKRIAAELRERNIPSDGDDGFRMFLFQTFDIANSAQITEAMLPAINEWIEKWPRQPQG